MSSETETPCTEEESTMPEPEDIKTYEVEFGRDGKCYVRDFELRGRTPPARRREERARDGGGGSTPASEPGAGV